MRGATVRTATAPSISRFRRGWLASSQEIDTDSAEGRTTPWRPAIDIGVKIHGHVALDADVHEAVDDGQERPARTRQQDITVAEWFLGRHRLDRGRQRRVTGRLPFVDHPGRSWERRGHPGRWRPIGSRP